MKSKQSELTLFHDSKRFKQAGLIHIVAASHAVYAICFERELEGVYKRLSKKYKLTIIEKSNLQTKKALKQLDEYFTQKRTKFDLNIELIGTDFQKKVWNVLSKIPYGETTTYKNIGLKLKIKNGFQAIGQANRANPVCLVLPCHRVISSTGQLSGYIGGAGLKSYLLSLESAKIK